MKNLIKTSIILQIIACISSFIQGQTNIFRGYFGYLAWACFVTSIITALITISNYADKNKY